MPKTTINPAVLALAKEHLRTAIVAQLAVWNASSELEALVGHDLPVFTEELEYACVAVNPDSISDQLLTSLLDRIVNPEEGQFRQ